MDALLRPHAERLRKKEVLRADGGLRSALRVLALVARHVPEATPLGGSCRELAAYFELYERCASDTWTYF